MITAGGDGMPIDCRRVAAPSGLRRWPFRLPLGDLAEDLSEERFSRCQLVSGEVLPRQKDHQRVVIGVVLVEFFEVTDEALLLTLVGEQIGQ